MNPEDDRLRLPFDSKESLRRLAELLQHELRTFFSDHGETLSNNGYIFFQLYNFSITTAGYPYVEYPYTDSFNLYPESETELSRIYEEITGGRFDPQTPIGKPIVKQILSRIVTDSTALTPRRTLISAPLFHDINQLIDKAADPSSSPEEPLQYLSRALKSLLRELKQPATLGLAHERFKNSTLEITGRSDIRESQKRASSTSEASKTDRATYRAITSIERFFFLGAIQSRHSQQRSFIRFADVFCYGQRAGYLFIIESYNNEAQRKHKMSLARRFLQLNRSKTEYLVRETKERSFWTKILTDIERAEGVLTEEQYIGAIQAHLPEIVNVGKGAVEPTSERLNGISIIEKSSIGVCEVCIPLRLKDSVDNDDRFIGTLKLLLDPIDVKPKSERTKKRGAWEGLASPWNNYELLRALSSGLNLFNLNRRLQRVAADAEWKLIFDKLFHSQKHYLAALTECSKGLSGDSKVVVAYLADVLEGFLTVAKHLDSMDQFISQFECQEISLSELLDSSVHVLTLLLRQRSILSKCFKISTPEGEESLLQKGVSVFDLTYVKNSYRIKSFKEPILLLLKDLLVNAVENCDEKDPVVTIKVVEESTRTVVAITNNSGCSLVQYKAMASPTRNEKRFGMVIAHSLVKGLGWKLDISDSCLKLDQTTVQVVIPV